MESREHVLEAVKKRWTLDGVSEVWRSDREVVLTAVQKDGRALELAAETLRGDRAMVLAAVQQDGRALQYATEALRGDREIVLTALQNSGSALRYASEALRGDREIVLRVVRELGQALEYASEAVRADREVVLASVQDNGHALCFVTEPLRADREIVLAAVQQTVVALDYAAAELLEDPTFATEAKRHFFLLRLTMLSGRSTVVLQYLGDDDVHEVLDRCREKLREKLGLADDGATIELWYGLDIVPADAIVEDWPGIEPRGEISDYQLLVMR